MTANLQDRPAPVTVALDDTLTVDPALLPIPAWAAASLARIDDDACAVPRRWALVSVVRRVVTVRLTVDRPRPLVWFRLFAVRLGLRLGVEVDVEEGAPGSVLLSWSVPRTKGGHLTRDEARALDAAILLRDKTDTALAREWCLTLQAVSERRRRLGVDPAGNAVVVPQSAVEELLNGAALHDVSRRYGVGRTALRTALRRANKGGV